MLLSRAAVIWQSDGFAKLQRLCHTLFFCHLFFVHPFFVSYLVLFLGIFHVFLIFLWWFQLEIVYLQRKCVLNST